MSAKTWFATIPAGTRGGLMGGLVGFVLAFLVCNLMGRPTNDPNLLADSLASTRKAYETDTLRLVGLLDSLKAEEAKERQAKEVERAKWIAAEQRAAAARVTAANARVVLARARTTRDSLDAALALIARQEDVIAADSASLSSAAAAFGRLTAEHRATLERADSLDAGWRRTTDRLGLAEAALAIEQKRTSCAIHLVVTQVRCPSRGVVAVISLAAGVAGTMLVQPRN